MSKISIVIPVYNVESYLKRCLDSSTNKLKNISLENIFSVKNDTTHKVINVLGLKIKIKNKKLINRFQNKQIGNKRGLK